MTPTTDDAFVIATHQELTRILRRSCRLSRQDADDAASLAIIRLLPRVARIRATYPTPEKYASAVAHNAAADFRRFERTQRGEGARLVADPSQPARVTARRTVVPFGPETEPYLRSAAPDDTAVAAVEAAHTLAHLTPRDRTLVWLVKVDRYTVTEAAHELALTREHASRRLTALMTELRALAHAA